MIVYIRKRRIMAVGAIIDRPAMAGIVFPLRFGELVTVPKRALNERPYFQICTEPGDAQWRKIPDHP